MNIHYLQHVPFEGLGAIAQWAAERGHSVTRTRLFNDDLLPAVDEVDMLIVMGGPMGVHDGEEHPWLAEEKRCVREFVEAGKPVLGICLGAQLIAAALGARVYKTPFKEIGWFRLELTKEGTASPLAGLSDIGAVFHWHGETYDLPEGAVLLASSEGCVNQAFSINDKVVGLQFHIEMGREEIAAIVENCPDDITQGKYVQSPDEMTSVSSQTCRKLKAVLFDLLDHLVAQ